MQEEIRLSAKVFDTLKAEAERVGGIGKSEWFRSLGEVDYTDPIEGFTSVEEKYDINCPICINGMAVSTGLVENTKSGAELGINPALPLDESGVSYRANDRTVVALINQGQFTTDQHGIQRVSWDDYVRELNIVRVEDDA